MEITFAVDVTPESMLEVCRRMYVFQVTQHGERAAAAWVVAMAGCWRILADLAVIQSPFILKES